MLTSYFDGKPLNHQIHPDEAVAAGAAILASILNGDKAPYLKDIFLLDVTPLSLGVEVKSGLLSVLIKKNTPLPIK